MNVTMHVTNDTFTGVRKDSVQLKRFKSGIVDVAYTGLDIFTEDGKWYYFEKGVHDSKYTGIMQSTYRKLYYAKSGVWYITYTGLAQYTDGKWYFVRGTAVMRCIRG